MPCDVREVTGRGTGIDDDTLTHKVATIERALKVNRASLSDPLNTLAAVGGMMVPTFVMPEFMQTLSKVSPHNWALAGYQDVIVRGLGMNAVMIEVGVLMAFAAVFFVFALWRFRFE